MMYQKKEAYSGPWEGSGVGIRANRDIINNSESIEMRDNPFHRFSQPFLCAKVLHFSLQSLYQGWQGNFSIFYRSLFLSNDF